MSSSNNNYRVCGEKSFETNAIYHIILLLNIIIHSRRHHSEALHVSVQITELKNQFIRSAKYNIACLCPRKPIGRVHWQRVMSCSAVNRATDSSISFDEEQKNVRNGSRKSIADGI